MDKYAHMAILPYPGQYSIRWQLADGIDILIRPIRPEDASIETEFIAKLSERSRYFRFMSSMRQLTPEMLVRFTQIDYDREMALIAVLQDNERETEIGVARYISNPDGYSCEFAIVIADDWTKKGIGTKLLRQLMQIAKSRGLHRMEGEVLTDNHTMLHMAKNLGFNLSAFESDNSLTKVTKRL